MIARLANWLKQHGLALDLTWLDGEPHDVWEDS